MATHACPLCGQVAVGTFGGQRFLECVNSSTPRSFYDGQYFGPMTLMWPGL